MQSNVAYEIQGLALDVPVVAFCFDRETSYVAQTDHQDTVVTQCQLDDTKHVATADNHVSFRLKQFNHVNSLSLLHQAPQLKLLISGQPVSDNGELGRPEMQWLGVDMTADTTTVNQFQITNLEAANITGTPLPQPVIGAASALSSNRHELAVLVLDQAQHLQATVYDVAKLAHLIWQLSSHHITSIEAGDLRVMATAYQSFRPTAKQLAPDTIGSIQSIGFSNGRALYATKSHGQERAVSKGFWLLKAGFQDLTVDDLSEDQHLTGLQLQGDDVYFVVTQMTKDGRVTNQIRSVLKANW